MCHSGSVGFLAKRASLYRGWPATQVVKRVVNPVVNRFGGVSCEARISLSGLAGHSSGEAGGKSSGEAGGKSGGKFGGTSGGNTVCHSAVSGKSVKEVKRRAWRVQSALRRDGRGRVCCLGRYRAPCAKRPQRLGTPLSHGVWLRLSTARRCGVVRVSHTS